MFIRKIEVARAAVLATAVAALLVGCQSDEGSEADQAAAWREPAPAPTVPVTAQVCGELATIMKATAVTGTKEPDSALVRRRFTATSQRMTKLAATTADPATKGAIEALAKAYRDATNTSDPMRYMDRRAGTWEKPINDACAPHWKEK